jgi:type III secretory pathway component EscS
MFETEPKKTPRSTREVILGFLLGVLASLVGLIVCIFLGMTLGLSRDWLFPVINGLGLVVVGVFALRRVRESSLALGVLIAISLTFLLNAACGVVMFR